MQDSKDAGHEEFRWDAGLVGCGIQERRNSGDEEYRKRGIQNWRDTGKAGFRRRDAGQEGC